MITKPTNISQIPVRIPGTTIVDGTKKTQLFVIDSIDDIFTAIKDKLDLERYLAAELGIAYKDNLIKSYGQEFLIGTTSIRSVELYNKQTICLNIFTYEPIRINGADGIVKTIHKKTQIIQGKEAVCVELDNGRIEFIDMNFNLIKNKPLDNFSPLSYTIKGLELRCIDLENGEQIIFDNKGAKVELMVDGINSNIELIYIKRLIFGRALFWVKLDNGQHMFVDQDLKPVVVLGTNNLIIEFYQEEQNISGKRVFSVKLDNGDKILVNQKFEKIELKVAGTNDNINRIYIKNIVFGREIFWVKLDYNIYIFVDSELRPLGVKGTEDTIVEFYSIRKTILEQNLAGQQVISVKLDNDKWILVNPKFEKIELKVVGTNDIIARIYKKFIIGEQEIYGVKLENNKYIFVNYDLKPLKVKGTDFIITDIGAKQNITGNKIYWVKLDNNEIIFVDSNLNQIQFEPNNFH